MIVAPEVSRNPYTTEDLSLLLEKFLNFTKVRPDKYIKDSVKILQVNYKDDEIIDEKLLNNFLQIYFDTYCGVDTTAEIFRNSILLELLILNEYHTVKNLKLELLRLLSSKLIKS